MCQETAQNRMKPYVKNEILPVVTWKAFLKCGNPFRSVEIVPEIKWNSFQECVDHSSNHVENSIGPSESMLERRLLSMVEETLGNSFPQISVCTVLLR